MKYDISFCCDDNYIIPALVSLESLLASNIQNSDSFIFHTFSGSLREENLTQIHNLLNQYGSKLELIEMPKEFLSLVEHFDIKVNHISVTTFYRLLLPYVLTDVESCLYIDCDILVRGDITSIFLDKNDNYCIRAVQDDAADYYSKLINVTKYCNAGVLLMNFDSIRKKYTYENYINQLKYIKDNYNLRLGDQDIINLLFEDSIDFMPNTFNYQSHLLKLKTAFHHRELNEVIIIHFITEEKAWLPTYFYPLVGEYSTYLKKHLSLNGRIRYWLGKPRGILIHFVKYFIFFAKNIYNKLRHH